MNRFIPLALFAAALLAGARPASALPADAETCLGCHADAASNKPRLDAFDASAHKKLACADCHKDAAEFPHPKKPGRVDCGRCHKEAASGLKGTEHGQKFLKGAKSLTQACEGCHGGGHDAKKVSDPASKAFRKNQPALCGGCHGGEKPAMPLADGRSRTESYLATVHGEAEKKGNPKAAACADCHSAHSIRRAVEGATPISPENTPKTCGRCHAEESAKFMTSIHGQGLLKGIREAPGCTDCHGEHNIRRPAEKGATTSKAVIAMTCASCHESERLSAKFNIPADRVSTFAGSYHGLASKAGNMEVANCASCHGWHDVLPSSSPASRIHPSHLAQTCGECHPGAGARLASLKVHEALAGTGEGSRAAYYARLFYYVMIPLVLLGMLFHNALDLPRKALAKGPLAPLREEEEVMLTLNERAQHLVLMLSFTLLAYSGFALKFPQSWWAAPFLWIGGDHARLLSHRIMALLFILLGFFHLGYMVLTREGRGRLRALFPAVRDLYDPFKLVGYNLGWLRERPLLPRFSYIEKAEYWALVWGSIVMVVSGGVLIFHNFALAHFPLWVLDVCRVVHYLEAVLACAAIFVWHLYWVVYDPEIYPMNWAWLIGRTKFREDRLSDRTGSD
ncbi:MAG TPA: hypothetical protein DCM05_14245 [Elusimicrobia bacterium]|nr:hypothetical protein [Elusimicrobiota bacterium]